MRLTNTIRDAFIRAAMQDVPKVNYEEQAHAVALADSIEALPAQLRQFALDKNLNIYLSRQTCWFSNSPFGSLMVFGERNSSFQASATAQKKIDALTEKAREQSKVRGELEAKLHAAAYSVTTRKALVALLPEFEKYLPADEPAACRTLPAIANLVADFTKAGWPKQQTKVAA